MIDMSNIEYRSLRREYGAILAAALAAGGANPDQATRAARRALTDTWLAAASRPAWLAAARRRLRLASTRKKNQ